MSITNHDTTANIFIGLFSVPLFIGIVVFAYLLISNRLKVKRYLKKKNTDY